MSYESVKRWVPPYRVIVSEHGPNIPACFFTLILLPVISAEDYGREPVTAVYTCTIHNSRS